MKIEAKEGASGQGYHLAELGFGPHSDMSQGPRQDGGRARHSLCSSLSATILHAPNPGTPLPLPPPLFGGSRPPSISGVRKDSTEKAHHMDSGFQFLFCSPSQKKAFTFVMKALVLSTKAGGGVARQGAKPSTWWSECCINKFLPKTGCTFLCVYWLSPERLCDPMDCSPLITPQL